MKKSRVTPQATLVAQMPAGIETECIVDKGVLYVPVMTLPEVTDSASNDDDEPIKKVPKEKETKETKETTKPTQKVKAEVTTDATIDIASLKVGDRILVKCEDFADPKKFYPGEVEKVKGGKALIHFDEDEDSEWYSEDDELTIKLDSAKVTKKKVVEDDEDEKPRSKKKVVEDDEDEKPRSKKKVVEDDEDDEDEKPKKDSKKAPKGEEVKPKSLEEGDEVSVYWANIDDWFNGTVTKIKDGKVYVKYEDEDTEVIDPEFHTKIIRK